MLHPHSAYRGRFAPSPTGPLHFGSLYTAVASFLQAKSQHGQWLLRIDDLDHSRCKPEYSSKILRTLERYGLEWDETVFYQSTRQNAYQEALSQLDEQSLLYPCQCSRKDLNNRRSPHGLYDGYCLNHPIDSNKPSALRIRIPNKTVSLTDLVQGVSQQNLKASVGDFVMFRKDRVYAYHLAVVLDDHEQRITEVLRGYDLLDSTYRQVHLQQLLQLPTPEYAHIPVISDAAGSKLSKQTYADDVSLSPVRETLISILGRLNLTPPNELLYAKPHEILKWGTDNWSLCKVQPHPSILF